jgi:integrase
MPVRTAVKLTKTRVQEFKRNPDGARTQYKWDIVEAGLGVSVSMLGKKSWVFRYNPPGKQKQTIIKIGEFPAHSVEQAREIVREKKRIRYAGRDPRYSTGGKTVEEFYDSMISTTHFKQKPIKTQKGFEGSMTNWVLPVIGGYPLTRVRRIDVRAVLDRILGKGLEGACRSAHSVMMTFFGYAMNAALIENSPATNIKMEYVTSGALDRHLSHDEIRDVMELPDIDPANLLLKFLLLTGCRINEGRQMKWSDIEDDVIHFPKTKTVPHTLPITKMMQEVLGRARVLNGRREYVFNSLRSVRNPVGEDSIRRKLHRCIDETATPHTLRHTAVSEMGDLEIPLEQISLVVNHKVGGMTGKYSHGKALGKKRKALKKYHKLISSIISTGEGAASA